MGAREGGEKERIWVQAVGFHPQQGLYLGEYGPNWEPLIGEVQGWGVCKKEG